MNRLILVGNGFDLAHGLKTSYQDFIDDFWENELKEINTGVYMTEQNSNHIKLTIDYETSFIIDNAKNYSDIMFELKFKSIKMIFKNDFLHLITKKCYENWVDIENEFYNTLKDCKEDDIDKLNENFNEVKLLFTEYLNKISKSPDTDTIAKIENHIHSLIRYDDLSSLYNDNLAQEILNKINTNLSGILNENITANNIESEEERELILRIRDLSHKKTEKEIIKDLLLSGQKSLSDILKLIPQSTLILNFNYTNITDNYLKNLTEYNINKFTVKHIHGELNNETNPIIFGFGDDTDIHYTNFENLNENRYMQFFKSIAYLQTDNYKKLLEFLDVEDFQVFIFGHSCGISDRTMLNTIFEHDNCKSVKPFYHKRRDGSDNYTDIVQNISRNFSDKKKFRDRVVNKTYCEPLT